jgi:hypothetical protein
MKRGIKWKRNILKKEKSFRDKGWVKEAALYRTLEGVSVYYLLKLCKTIETKKVIGYLFEDTGLDHNNMDDYNFSECGTIWVNPIINGQSIFRIIEIAKNFIEEYEENRIYLYWESGIKELCEVIDYLSSLDKRELESLIVLDSLKR